MGLRVLPVNPDLWDLQDLQEVQVRVAYRVILEVLDQMARKDKEVNLEQQEQLEVMVPVDSQGHWATRGSLVVLVAQVMTGL